jgi:hypothetical protein
LKKINDILKYNEGDIVHPHVLYTSGRICVFGKVDFVIYGSCKLNGVNIKDTSLHVYLKEPVILTIGKDSALLFNRAPLVPKEMPEKIEVPDLPDYETEHERAMFQMFENWAKQKGMVVPGKQDNLQDDDDFDDIDDDDEGFEFDIPLDTQDDDNDIDLYQENVDSLSDIQSQNQGTRESYDAVSEEQKDNPSDEQSN